jgi:hypothetical protein
MVPRAAPTPNRKRQGRRVPCFAPAPSGAAKACDRKLTSGMLCASACLTQTPASCGSFHADGRVRAAEGGGRAQSMAPDLTKLETR